MDFFQPTFTLPSGSRVEKKLLCVRSKSGVFIRGETSIQNKRSKFDSQEKSSALDLIRVYCKFFFKYN